MNLMTRKGTENNWKIDNSKNSNNGINNNWKTKKKGENKYGN
jgi:hypothetical protein